MAIPAFETPLQRQLIQLIADKGPITFRDYMALALYHPEHGYYAQSIQRVGKQGDFVTSISVGKCFGMILAQRLIRYWKSTGSPTEFHIIEPGAHDGALCADILLEIKTTSPEFYENLHYHLIEATPALQTTQEEKLSSDFAGKFTTHPSLSEISGLHGAILSNELIDAFPVDLIRFEQGEWKQLFVNITDDTSDNPLTLTAGSFTNSTLENFCSSLGQDFSEGYTTEYNPGIEEFASDCARTLSSGLFITIDYGHSSEDLYHPDRSTGTLQTYHQHQKADDPLHLPGEIDITTHIDFTRLIRAAESEGFTLSQHTMQSSYLTQHARDWLLSMEASPTPEMPALLRQFQTLIHPSMLGTKFTVLEMEKRAEMKK